MRIQSLQILRAVAAWLVVYHHYMQIFYEFESESIFGAIFSHRGGFGVDIFFVLSGFVMFVTATRHSADGWSFFIKRLFRIFPAYWFFTFALVAFGALMPGVFDFTDFTLGSIVQSLLFVPNSNPSGLGVFPFLTVGWTLNFEVCFYMVLTFSLFINKNLAIYLCALFLLSLPFLLADQGKVSLSVISSPLMWQFVFGMSVGWLHARYSLAGMQRKYLGIILLVLSMIVVSGLFGYGIVQRTISATMLLASFVLLNDMLSGRSGIVNFAVRLGDYSYSTYLSHVLVLGVFLHFFGNEFSRMSEGFVLISVSLVIYIVSFLSFRMIENSQAVSRVRDRLVNINVKAEQAVMPEEFLPLSIESIKGRKSRKSKRSINPI